MLHQMAAGIVDDDRMGDAVLAEFPCRQRSALVARPRLVDPDMHGNAGIMRLVDGRGGGAPVDGREPAGIAMGENIDRLAGRLARRRGADEGEAVIADRRTERDILVGDASGAGQGCRRAFAGRQRHDEPAHPLERPGEIDGGRPGRGETFAGAGETRVGCVFAQSKGDAIGGGHADERRAAHPHVGDRGRRFGQRGEAAHFETVRQLGLIDDLDFAVAGIPRDRAEMSSTDAHRLLLVRADI